MILTVMQFTVRILHVSHIVLKKVNLNDDKV